MFLRIITDRLDKIHENIRYPPHQHLPSKSISLSLMFIENFPIQNGVQYLFGTVHSTVFGLLRKNNFNIFIYTLHTPHS